MIGIQNAVELSYMGNLSGQNILIVGSGLFNICRDACSLFTFSVDIIEMIES